VDPSVVNGVCGARPSTIRFEEKIRVEALAGLFSDAEYSTVWSMSIGGTGGREIRHLGPQSEGHTIQL
jgi:hypothetical protein